MGTRSGLIQRLRCSGNFLPLHLKKWQALLDLPLGGTERLRVTIDSLFETGQCRIRSASPPGSGRSGMSCPTP